MSSILKYRRRPWVYLRGNIADETSEKTIDRQDREDFALRTSGAVVCLLVYQWNNQYCSVRVHKHNRDFCLVNWPCRNAVGRRARPCKRRRLAAFVLAAVRNKRDRIGCTTVNVGNKAAGIGRRYLIKTIKPVVRFGAARGDRQIVAARCCRRQDTMLCLPPLPRLRHLTPL